MENRAEQKVEFDRRNIEQLQYSESENFRFMKHNLKITVNMW